MSDWKGKDVSQRMSNQQFFYSYVAYIKGDYCDSGCGILVMRDCDDDRSDNTISYSAYKTVRANVGYKHKDADKIVITAFNRV